MSCTTDGATFKFKKRILTACLIIVLSDNVIGKVCKTGQKLRVNKQGEQICCNTVKCGKSQQFYYCQYDGEKDTCRNCTNNSYTDDLIDTSQWPIHDNGKYQAETQICSPLPSCKAEEVVLVGRKCQCNLNEGYWGTDEHNCQLDKLNCKRAGVQLTYEGQCVPCSGDTFKQKDGEYGQCVNKTRCKSHEIENSGGSSTTDRTCKKLPTEKPPITTAPPDTRTTNRPVKEGDNSISDWIVAVIVLIVIGLMIGVFVILYRKNKRFADCCRRFVDIVQSGFQRLGCRQAASKIPEEHEMVGPGENESEESPSAETKLLIKDETNSNSNMNGLPFSNGAVGSDRDHQNKHRDSELDPTETNLKSVTQDEEEHLSSSEEETVPKSVINKKDKTVSNIPTTDKEAKSHPQEQSQDSIGCTSLPSSLYGDRSGSGGDMDTNTTPLFSGSGYEADHSSASGQDVPSQSNPNDTTISSTSTGIPSELNPALQSFKSTYVNDTSASTGNIPNASLIDNLDTIPEIHNNDGGDNKKKPEFVRAENPPVVPVAPTPRSPATDQVNPNLGRADNRQDQDFRPSNTTAGGIDVEPATNDENFKVAPSSSNRQEQEPLTVKFPDKQQTESLPAVGNQGSNEPSVTSGSASSESGIQPPHRSSSENHPRPLCSSGTTESGQPLGAPESDNSQGSSTAQNSMEDDPQENIEVSSRTRPFD
ncbi:uncharacterized protein LOC127720104 [Mytilus californianus]|uniref:uncharacterized protein LOC127720104 n=1 Tax=Mytilus californianus TaxID=6549 RepID=UPI00224781F1|nr:uncharacterized protein LOC127720104 [Mytilus californianus]